VATAGLGTVAVGEIVARVLGLPSGQVMVAEAVLVAAALVVGLVRRPWNPLGVWFFANLVVAEAAYLGYAAMLTVDGGLRREGAVLSGVLLVLEAAGLVLVHAHGDRDPAHRARAVFDRPLPGLHRRAPDLDPRATGAHSRHPRTSAETAAMRPALPRFRGFTGGVVVVAGLVVVVLMVGVVYRGQIRRRVTHRLGGPRQTVAWQPFTASEPALVHLALAGDVGGRGRGVKRVRAIAEAVRHIDSVHPLDGLVLLGDNVYPSGDPGRLDETVFGPFAGVLDHVPLLAVLGNHDVRHGHAAGQVAALGMPGRWWAHAFGEHVLLVGLDSNLVDDPAQQDWLARTLAAATQPWRIVVVHHSPYSAGYQESDLAVRRAFVPLFERFGVQLVVSGHDHDYQRSTPVGGVTYLVSGGAAGTRRTGRDDFTAVSFRWHHFVELAVFPDRLVARAVSPTLRVADQVVMANKGVDHT
jgi:hypothetical protein